MLIRHLPRPGLLFLPVLAVIAVLSCATAPPPPPALAPPPAERGEATSAPAPIPPPVKPVGEHEVAATVRGCLALANLGQEPEERLPPKRGADEPMPELVAEAYDWGLVVRHELRHPCCLKGAIDAEIEGNLVVVTERLTGTPCNCYCWSTVITRVGLPAGDYDLLVEQLGPVSEDTLLFTTFEIGNQGD